MLEKVKNYIEKWHMLKSEDKVIVGVSGGADSICLVLVLLELQKTIGFEMVAVHVNHGLRGAEADGDQAYVKDFCEKQGLFCEAYFENVELVAKKWKQSTEEAGREVRRRFFEQAMQKHGGTKIALAHHQDDSAETFLIHLARGTGLRGLGGIAPVKGNVIRPLLCVRRKEIEDYLIQCGVEYRIDQTNASDCYTRNRIRNHILPYLEEQVNPKTVAHMNETMEQIRQVQELLDEFTQTAWEKSVQRVEKGYHIEENSFLTAPNVIKPLLIKQVMATVCGCEKDLEAVHVNQIYDLFAKQTGRKLDLPYRMEAIRDYQGILIRLKEEEKECLAEKVFDITQEEASFKWGEQEIYCRKINANACSKKHTETFNCDIIRGNVSFRTRREGDYITIHPDGRTQKLKSYFINEKIPQSDRDKILLVAEGSHILWIVGYRKNCAYEVNEETKNILEIEIHKGEGHGSKN